jgi:signal transduction histidine kinase
VQVKARSRGELKSKGLGLTFCKLAVEAHHGSIWVEGEAGQGAVFCFTLPREYRAARS